ncbi:hypothetical protein GCM10007853_02320 [Algimonas ampicilliniresistens]|uniref:DUF1579 domain-containing protein n=1 Tax=Algimonas ampicilliniresistens TaxID=1298735 RepID=A0ABQ5V676_9PROT|nr:hypothetical protein [Algimonas ampicilliniresistens]GLQ22358.1 hypothetical protein GCM10007853_02320 [Algimonas ampicilliniresistens]
MTYTIRPVLIGTIALLGIAACSEEPQATQADPVSVSQDTTQAAPVPTAIPDWARANIAYMTEGTGRWVADNAAYKSDAEPWEFYVMEWSAGPDDLSMTARMYATIDGQPSQADFWSFYQYWDRASGEMRVVQSGWGVVGDGTMTLGDDGKTHFAEQTFTAEGRPPNRVKHESRELSPTEHETKSLNWTEDGTWEADRSYIWVRTDAA